MDYFILSLVSGDPRTWVKADLDVSINKEFVNESLAYKMSQGTQPRKIDPRFFPTSLTLTTRRKVPAFFNTTASIMVVDEHVRSAIERIEPATHQYVPISVFHKDGAPSERKHFILNVHRTVRALDLAACGGQTVTALDGSRVVKLPPYFGGRTPTLNAAAIGSAHFWMDNGSPNLSDTYFVSSEMVEAMTQAGAPIASTNLRECLVI